MPPKKEKKEKPAKKPAKPKASSKKPSGKSGDKKKVKQEDLASPAMKTSDPHSSFQDALNPSSFINLVYDLTPPGQ
jgi:hypothetical protein